jgi:hypothetical protein
VARFLLRARQVTCLEILAKLLEIGVDLLELALIVLGALCRVNLCEKDAASDAGN